MKINEWIRLYTFIFRQDLLDLLFFISTEGGLCFINFFRKLMKTKKYPDNPVDPVQEKENIIESIPINLIV